MDDRELDSRLGNLEAMSTKILDVLGIDINPETGDFEDRKDKK